MATMTERQLVEVGTHQANTAKAMAALESAEMSTVMVSLMESKEVTEQGAINIMLALRKTYGDKLMEFPRPGSTVENSNNPDVIKVEKKNPNTGNKTVVKSSWYVTFADATKEGQAILQELGWIKILRNAEADHNLVPKEFRGKHSNPELQTIHEAYLTGRRATIRKAYKDALALMWAMWDINSLAQVNADFVWVDPETQDKVKNTKKPIRVSSTKNADEWAYITQSTATRFDFAKAQENGGTFTALFDTLKRDKETDNANVGAAAKPQLVRTPDTFDARITDIHEALEFSWSADGKAFRAELNKRLLSDGSDDLLISLDDIHEAIGKMLGNERVAAKLEAARQKQDASDKAA